MSNKPEVTAVVVARKGSVRVPNKAMLPLGEETILARKIRQLKACKNIDRVVFGSDCELMLEHAHAHGAEPVRRPDHYCDERVASANDMIKNMCSLINTDVVVWAHPTNPLLSTATYDAAVDSFLSNLGQYDSLLSVHLLKEHLWTEDKCPFNYNPYAERHIPARDLPPLYMQDGGIFIQPHAQMLDNAYFFGRAPYLFVIPEEEFLDINTHRDYIFAKTLIESGGHNV